MNGAKTYRYQSDTVRVKSDDRVMAADNREHERCIILLLDTLSLVVTMSICSLHDKPVLFYESAILHYIWMSQKCRNLFFTKDVNFRELLLERRDDALLTTSVSLSLRVNKPCTLMHSCCLFVDTYQNNNSDISYEIQESHAVARKLCNAAAVLFGLKYINNIQYKFK